MLQLRRAQRVTMQELSSLAGTRLGSSAPVVITQERIDTFADATGDRQWIHVDPVRAESGPFGTTIAHGFLTLSLAVEMLAEIFEVSDCAQVVNYGLNRVRFPAPVRVGARLHASADILAVEPCVGGYQATITLTFEVEDGARPVCVAEMLLRFYAAKPDLPTDSA